MSEDVFDTIIVGAGLAGATAALVLAREGANVLVIERGNYAGAKNVTGGRLYGHSLQRLIPDLPSRHRLSDASLEKNLVSDGRQRRYPRLSQ